MVASNSSQAEMRQWGRKICHVMDIRANRAGLPGWGGGGCEVEEINFLLCDLEENDQHAGSIFGGKRTCIRDCPELQIRWV